MSELREWLRAMPKAELHVHLEGTLTPELYRKIAERNNIAAEDPEKVYRCSDFASFLQAFLTTIKVLRQPDDFAEIARAYLLTSAAEGVKHVELMFSPATLRIFAPTLDLDIVVTAIVAEIERAKTESGISALLILDLVRNLGVNAGLRDVQLAHRHQSIGVVGVGLGGDERNYPASTFQDVFADAERDGLRRTAHGGEAAGPQSIIEAVMLLHAERIGHGTAASRQSKVLKLLLDKNVTIDACPTSNFVTGAVKTRESHPLKEFLDVGLSVTLNSDDPAFFGASLVDEYEHAATSLGLSRAELVKLAANSFRASFAPQEKKAAWLAELERHAAS